MAPPRAKKTSAPAKGGPPYAGPAWTKAQRAALRGARTRHPLDPPPPPRTRAEAWPLLVAAARDRDEKFGAIVPQNDAARALLEPVLRSYDAPEPPATLDPVTELLRLHALYVGDPSVPAGPAMQALLALWIDTHGYGFFFELARCPVLHVLGGRQYGDGRRERVFDAEDQRTYGRHRAPWGHPLQSREVLSDLRRHFWALGEDEWPAHRGAFLEAYEKSAPGAATRAEEDDLVAFVLARDPSLAHARFAGPDGARRHPTHIEEVLSAVADFGLALEVTTVAGAALQQLAEFALEWVETFGARAADLLQPILDADAKARRKMKPHYRRPLEAAIKLAKTAPAP